MSENQFKSLPSVSEVLLEVPDGIQLHQKVITRIIRNGIARFRRQANSGELRLSRKQIIGEIVRNVVRCTGFSLQNVINGTGIVLHTGFGRAPIEKKVLNRVAMRLEGYANLEFDLVSGQRGNRLDHIRDYLSAIVETESSLMVNNNAAAVLLTLNTLAEGKEVIISRGQQVEIGGSFRMPDIIAKSHCILREVGATNRTHLKDYEKAMGPETGLLLWVHTSNYVVEGFTKEVTLRELVELGRKKRVPVMADLGSGALINLSVKNLPDEIPVQDVVKSGASIVTFSGDKLLGGPQAGLIVGKKRILNKIIANPIYRAVRCDKLTIALMEETLRTYQSKDVTTDNLTMALLTTKRSVLRKRGRTILNSLSKKRKSMLGITLVESNVEAGSGSLPVVEIESMSLKFRPVDRKVSELAQQFRMGEIPVVGYTAGNVFYIDLKAVLPKQIPRLIEAIEKIV